MSIASYRLVFQTLNNELFVTTNTTKQKQVDETILYPSLFLFESSCTNNLWSSQCKRYKSMLSLLSSFVSRCVRAGSLEFFFSFVSFFLVSSWCISLRPFSYTSMILSYESFIRLISVTTVSLLKLLCFVVLSMCFIVSIRHGFVFMICFTQFYGIIRILVVLTVLLINRYTYKCTNLDIP